MTEFASLAGTRGDLGAIPLLSSSVAWCDPLGGINVEGPVTIEVFVLSMDGGVIELTGPCGTAPWYIEKAAR